MEFKVGDIVLIKDEPENCLSDNFRVVDVEVNQGEEFLLLHDIATIDEFIKKPSEELEHLNADEVLRAIYEELDSNFNNFFDISVFNEWAQTQNEYLLDRKPEDALFIFGAPFVCDVAYDWARDEFYKLSKKLHITDQRYTPSRVWNFGAPFSEIKDCVDDGYTLDLSFYEKYNLSNLSDKIPGLTVIHHHSNVDCCVIAGVWKYFEFVYHLYEDKGKLYLSQIGTAPNESSALYKGINENVASFDFSDLASNEKLFLQAWGSLELTEKGKDELGEFVIDF